MAKFKKEAVEIAAGVVRDVEAENPLNDNILEKKPRLAGQWIKVSQSELVEYEVAGRLKGYDPASGEALLN